MTSSRILRMLAVAALAATLAGCNEKRDPGFQGWVEADMIFVSPDESGRVIKLNVREGDEVKRGEQLYSVDDDLQNADLNQNKATLANAQQTYDRAASLSKTGSGTQATLDSAVSSLRVAEARVNTSETRLARRKGFAPVAGTIQQIYFRDGEMVPEKRPVLSMMPPGTKNWTFMLPGGMIDSTGRFSGTISPSRKRDLLDGARDRGKALPPREPRLRRIDPRLRDPQRRHRRVERGLRARAGLAQRRRPVIGLLRVGKRRLVLVEVGVLQVVVDRVELLAALDLVALAHVELDHPPGLVPADEDHVGLDPALETGIAFLVAAGERRGQCSHRKHSQYARRCHGLLRSEKIKSRWTRNISIASSGEWRSNRLFQTTATIAGATSICGKRASSALRIPPRAIASSISARMPASPREITSR